MYSSDGRTFAAVVSQHPDLSSIELIDPSTGRSRATLTTQHPLVYDLAFADGGRTIRAFLGDSGALKEATTWDVATGQQTSSRPITAPTRLCGRAISPDGRLLALIPWQSTAVQLWDLEADRPLGSLTDPTLAGNLIGHAVDFSPDGRTLAVARSDGAIDLWDVPGRKFLKTLPAHPRGYASMAIRFAPDGRTLASTAYENRSSTTLGETFENLKRKLLGSTRRDLARRDRSSWTSPPAGRTRPDHVLVHSDLHARRPDPRHSPAITSASSSATCRTESRTKEDRP